MEAQNGIGFCKFITGDIVTGEEPMPESEAGDSRVTEW